MQSLKSYQHNKDVLCKYSLTVYVSESEWEIFLWYEMPVRFVIVFYSITNFTGQIDQN